MSKPNRVHEKQAFATIGELDRITKEFYKAVEGLQEKNPNLTLLFCVEGVITDVIREDDGNVDNLRGSHTALLSKDDVKYNDAIGLLNRMYDTTLDNLREKTTDEKGKKAF